MENAINEVEFYENGPIRVTNKYLVTRYKDEALAPIQSVKVGRDPLWIAGIVGLGLIAFANRFGDLLLFHEQALLIGIGLITALAGFCIASLEIGQHMRERTVLIAPIWTIADVRKAISKAKHHERDASENGDIVLMDDPSE